jgi:hypothetical protein
MQLDFIITGLTLLYERVARHVSQHTAEVCLLLGLTVLTPAICVTNHLS